MLTGDEVEVLRESAGPGERRHYSKRFLVGPAGDLSPWTARERCILEQLGRADGAPVARLVPVPAMAGAGLHTFDAGPTIDQWSTRVLLRRNGLVLGNLFEDCACWWALARHCLIALDKLHQTGFVHLDLKADNLCIPWSQPGESDFPVPGRPIALRFEELAFIDVAFSLLPEVPLPGPLPLDRQPHYEYQSQRLLEALEQGRRVNSNPTRALDWRCDLFSLAAMLWRYLPKLERSAGSGWTPNRHAQATAFVRLLVEADSGPLPAQRPHAELIVFTEWHLREPELGAALLAGFTFEAERTAPSGSSTPLTRVFRSDAAAGPVDASSLATARAWPSPQHESRRADPAPLDTPLSVRDSAANSLPVDLPHPDPRSVASTPVDLSVNPRPVTSAPVDILLADLQPGGPASVDLPLPDLVPVEAAVCVPLPVSTPVDLSSLAVPTADLRSAGLPRIDPHPVAPQLANWHPESSRAEPAAVRIEPTLQPLAQPDSRRVEGTPTERRPPPGLLGRRRSHLHRAPIVAVLALGVVATLAWWGDRSGWLAVPRRAPALAAAPSGAAVPSLLAPRPASDARLALSGRSPGLRPPSIPSPTLAQAPSESGAPVPPSAVAVSPRTNGAAASPAVVAAPAVRPASSLAPGSAVEFDAATLPNLPRRKPGELPIEIFLPSPPRPASTAPARPDPTDGQPTFVGNLDDVGRQLLQGLIPRLAAGAERQLAPVLSAAGRANDAFSPTEVRAVARIARQGTRMASLPVVVATQQARRLNEAARLAYWQRHNVPDAVELQTKAFAANPLDTEVVGNLAFLRLRESPPQAESARALALHALTLKDDRFPVGRVEDWTTLAIANALTGHEVDARNAWFVTMAVSNDLERHCKAAVRAQALYGDRLRSSVQAMLERARSSPGYSRCGVQPERTARSSGRPHADTVPSSHWTRPGATASQERFAIANVVKEEQPSLLSRAWATVRRVLSPRDR